MLVFLSMEKESKLSDNLLFEKECYFIKLFHELIVLGQIDCQTVNFEVSFSSMLFDLHFNQAFLTRFQN